MWIYTNIGTGKVSWIGILQTQDPWKPIMTHRLSNFQVDAVLHFSYTVVSEVEMCLTAKVYNNFLKTGIIKCLPWKSFLVSEYHLSLHILFVSKCTYIYTIPFNNCIKTINVHSITLAKIPKLHLIIVAKVSNGVFLASLNGIWYFFYHYLTEF